MDVGGSDGCLGLSGGGLSGAVILGLECGGETQAFNVGALHIAQRG